MKNAKERIREQVLLALKNTDIHKVQVKSIVEAAGISRSTFYLYYDSVYSVLQDIEDEYFDGLRKANAFFWHYPLRKEYMSQPHPIFLNILGYLREHREVSNILRGPYGDVVFQIQCRKVLSQSLFPVELMKMYYPEDTELHIAFLLGGHMEAVQNWMSGGCVIPTEEFAVKLYQMMFSNLFRD